ncbi:MAG: proteasome-type protease, partial [Alphaproteobacteria bacterium]|nr:proteasome-type protease [Alphaproteobacteria bacterium]
MTYCLAIQLTDHLVFASDSRTSAGVDNVSVYSKMHVFSAAKDRYFTLLSAGNLA